ncbi:TadE/TadG family type IV pilus assembly protein [Streptomyces pathocidini]|uniref:TadE/TadG family type IV pilus assembly protein n=1 Tax=Streptomyces pathocidini TaxID=1650571 RepID=UPI0033C81DB2
MRTSLRRWRVRDGESGQVSLEFLGFLPILLILGLAAIQLGIAAYTVSQAGTAARAAARTASYEDPPTDPTAAGRAAISGWLASRADVRVTGGPEEATATTRVDIPSVIPGIGSFGTAERSATMPRD